MASAIKLYLDEHVDPDVAKGLRRRNVDVLTTQEAHMLSAKDEQQLALALSQNRAIFTQDTDFLQLVAAGASHAGVIYAHPRTPISILIEDLSLIANNASREELVNQSPWYLPL